MTAVDLTTLLGWRGRTVTDRDGARLGKLGALYLDAGTERPAYGGVHTGLFGRHESVVPLDALFEDEHGDLRVPFTTDEIRGAPSVDPDAVLTGEEETILRDYYGVAGPTTPPTTDEGAEIRADEETTGSGAPEPVEDPGEPRPPAVA